MFTAHLKTLTRTGSTGTGTGNLGGGEGKGEEKRRDEIHEHDPSNAGYLERQLPFKAVLLPQRCIAALCCAMFPRPRPLVLSMRSVGCKDV